MALHVVPVLTLWALAAPAQTARDEPAPVTVVREFYERDSIRAYDFYSARLKDLFVKDDEAAGGEMGNLTFAFQSEHAASYQARREGPDPE